MFKNFLKAFTLALIVPTVISILPTSVQSSNVSCGCLKITCATDVKTWYRPVARGIPDPGMGGAASQAKKQAFCKKAFGSAGDTAITICSQNFDALIKDEARLYTRNAKEVINLFCDVPIKQAQKAGLCFGELTGRCTKG